MVDDIKTFFGELRADMHDLVIKGGTVVDGTGAPGRTADVAITDGVVTEVGRVNELARETVDADGALVTPGFVDVHTHFDGQVTWDPLLTPTCWHGVTTVVMGNCGVGLRAGAARPPRVAHRLDGRRRRHSGRRVVDRASSGSGRRSPSTSTRSSARPLLFDVGTQVPHGAVRGYVMGERGAKNEPATAADIEQMADLVRGGIEAGALGFSTSRTIAHMAIDGEPVPGTFAAHDELFGIGRVLGELGTGVFELAPAGALGEDLAAPEREMAWMRELSAAIGRPVTFALTQNDHDPDSWSRMLELCAEAAADGAPVTPQVAGPAGEPAARARDVPPVRVLPVVGADRWRAARGEGRRDARSRDAPAAAGRGRRRDRADAPVPRSRARVPVRRDARLRAGARAAASPGIARAQGRSEMEVFYDALHGRRRPQARDAPVAQLLGLLARPVREMLAHPTTAWGLGDGGAHCGTTCDASTPTFMLTHWARDRSHDQLPLEFVVNKMTAQTATLYGLGDRGALAPGPARRRQRDRLRRRCGCRCPSSCTTCPPTRADSCRARRATSRRSSAAR